MLLQRTEDQQCVDILDLLLEQLEIDLPGEDVEEEDIQEFYEQRVSSLFELKADTPMSDYLEGF
jgi:hypothetical protein